MPARRRRRAAVRDPGRRDAPARTGWCCPPTPAPSCAVRRLVIACRPQPAAERCRGRRPRRRPAPRRRTPRRTPRRSTLPVSSPSVRSTFDQVVRRRRRARSRSTCRPRGPRCRPATTSSPSRSLGAALGVGRVVVASSSEQLVEQLVDVAELVERVVVGGDHDPLVADARRARRRPSGPANVRQNDSSGFIQVSPPTPRISARAVGDADRAGAVAVRAGLQVEADVLAVALDAAPAILTDFRSAIADLAASTISSADGVREVRGVPASSPPPSSPSSPLQAVSRAATPSTCDCQSDPGHRASRCVGPRGADRCSNATLRPLRCPARQQLVDPRRHQRRGGAVAGLVEEVAAGAGQRG